MESANPVVLITGSRKGIGRFLAEYYAQKGMLIEGCSRESPNWKLKNYTHHVIDVSNESDVKKMVSSVYQRHGRLDVVINNAGVMARNHILLTPVETVDKTMAVNFRGTFLVCRESAKIMQKQGHGRIVNMSTIAVPMCLEGESIYAASKNAIVSFTQILARELAGFNITCNIVAPTPIKTDMIEEVPQDKINDIIDRLAIKRLGRYEDIANVIDFFINPQSDYITGQVIFLGGVC